MAVWGMLQAGITLSERLTGQGQQFREWLFVRDQQKYSDAYDAMLSSLIGSKKCRLFATADGSYTGMVSGQATEGDVLAILAGASTPWLLRPRESDTEPVYELVGHTFSPSMWTAERLLNHALTYGSSNAWRGCRACCDSIAWLCRQCDECVPPGFDCLKDSEAFEALTSSYEAAQHAVCGRSAWPIRFPSRRTSVCPRGPVSISRPISLPKSQYPPSTTTRRAKTTIGAVRIFEGI